MKPAACAQCGCPILPHRQLAKLPKPRQARRRVGNICRACHLRATRPKTPRGMPRVPTELVMVDWEWLHETGELRSDMSLSERVRLAAPRIGMSATALDQTLRRTGVRGVVEQVMPKRVSSGPRCRTCDRLALDLSHASHAVNSAVHSLFVAERLGETPTQLRERFAAIGPLKRSRAARRAAMAKHAATHESRAVAA